MLDKSSKDNGVQKVHEGGTLGSYEGTIPIPQTVDSTENSFLEIVTRIKPDGGKEHVASLRKKQSFLRKSAFTKLWYGSNEFQYNGDSCKTKTEASSQSCSNNTGYTDIRCKLEPVIQMICKHCQKFRDPTSISCSVCGACTHLKCITGNFDKYAEEDLKYNWTCKDCVKLWMLLTPDEQISLLSPENKFINKNTFMYYHKYRKNGALYPVEEAVLMDLFDYFNFSHEKGIPWETFANIEAIRILEGRNNDQLISLLSTMEVWIIRKLWLSRDSDMTGEMTGESLTEVVQEWAAQRHYQIKNDLFQDDRTYSWSWFLTTWAKAILASRPNTSPLEPNYLGAVGYQETEAINAANNSSNHWKTVNRVSPFFFGPSSCYPKTNLVKVKKVKPMVIEETEENESSCA